MQPWDFITLLKTEELKTAPIASNLKKKTKQNKKQNAHTGTKRATMAIRLSFLIENFFA